LRLLNDEFKVFYARNPIHHIEVRIKFPESIAAKLLKKGLPPPLETARENINDIAGARVMCSYIDDVYHVVEMLERQKILRSSNGRIAEAEKEHTFSEVGGTEL
jgi:putative GTP pyrophosphokinase